MDDAPEGEAPDITTTDAHTGLKQTPSNEALMTAQQNETEDPVMTVGKAPAGDDPDPNPSVNDDPLAGCRVAIKLLDASDVPSSASSVSDPDSYLSATAWVGSLNEAVRNDDRDRIQQASCSSNMEGPRFDTELIFPLSVESIDDILSGQVAVTLTDGGDGGDDDQGGKTDVGQVKIPFEQIFKEGKPLSSCVIIAPRFYTLVKTKSMTRKAGSPKLRMSVSFFPGEGQVWPSKIHPDCKTFAELVEQIKRQVGGGGSSKEEEERQRRANGKGRRSSRSSSPQRLNKLESIVLSSGAPSPSRDRDTGGDGEGKERTPLPEWTRPDPVVASPSSKQKQVAGGPPPKASPRAPFAKSTANIHEIISQSNANYSKKAAAAWKNHVLQSLSRLEDKDTLSRSLGEIHQIVLMMQPHQVQPFLYQLKKFPRKATLATRKGILEIVEYTCLVHPQATATTKAMHTIMDIVLESARGVEDAVREGCVTAMSAVIRYSFPNSGFAKGARFSGLLEGLFSVFGEQQLSTKEAAGNCVAVAIRPMPPLIPVQISGNIRTMEDLRHALRPTKIPIPKETVVVPNRMALMFFRGKEMVQGMHSALSSAILPPGYVVEKLTKMENFHLNQSRRRHGKVVEANVEALMEEIVGAMGRNSPGDGADAQLYRCVAELCRVASDLPKEGGKGDEDDDKKEIKAKGGKIVPCMDRMGPYVVNKAIQSLNSKKKKHWKEKVEAIEMVTAMIKGECCEDYIFSRYDAIISAIGRAKAGVKQIRDAAAECLEHLEELRAKKSAGGAGAGDGDDGEDRDVVDFHEVDEPPPIKFSPEPEWGGEEDGGKDDGGGVAEEDSLDEDDSVKYPGGKSKKRTKQANDQGDDEDEGDDFMKRGRKKYMHQRKVGGLRSPRESGAGSASATVRMLKGLENKSVSLQRSLDDLARISADNLKGLNQRMKQVEVVVRKSGGLSEGGQQPPAQNIHMQRHMQQVQQQHQQPMARQPSEKELFFMSKGVKDLRKGVSTWREIQWLLHQSEIETAFQTALKHGDSNLVLRLMNETGVVAGRLSDSTCNALYGTMGELLSSGGEEIDLSILPWVFEIVRTKREGKLAPYVRDSLARALFTMISDPAEKGVLAAKLHPRIAM